MALPFRQSETVGPGCQFRFLCAFRRLGGILRGPKEWRGHRHLAPDFGRVNGVANRNRTVCALGIRGKGPLAGVVSGSWTDQRRLLVVPKRGADCQFPLSARRAYCRGWGMEAPAPDPSGRGRGTNFCNPERRRGGLRFGS